MSFVPELADSGTAEARAATSCCKRFNRLWASFKRIRFCFSSSVQILHSLRRTVDALLTVCQLHVHWRRGQRRLWHVPQLPAKIELRWNSPKASLAASNFETLTRAASNMASGAGARFAWVAAWASFTRFNAASIPALALPCRHRPNAANADWRACAAVCCCG